MSQAHMMPARAQAQSAFIDLDEMDYVPCTVQVNGKTITLKFVAVEDQGPIARSLHTLTTYVGGDLDQACENYLEFFRLLCPEMVMDDVKKMGYVKMHRLFRIFVEHIQAETAGKSLYEKRSDDEKKKILASTAPSS